MSAKPGSEALKQEPFIIDIREAAWVTKALSKERRVLTFAAVANVGGSVVLAATDTHRLHMLRLGPVSDGFPLPEMTSDMPLQDVPRSVKLIDLRRVLFEARYENATHIAIAQDLSEVLIGKSGPKRTPAFGPVYAPVFPDGAGTFPLFARIIPNTKRPVAELFAINSRYLADATELSSRASNRTVLYSECGENKPIVFQPNEDLPRWKAAVMPMALDGWGKVSHGKAA